MTDDSTKSPHDHSGSYAGLHAHEGGDIHWHDEFGEHSAEELNFGDDELHDIDWVENNVQVTTVGIDVGSSTSHLMFSKVHLQRIGEGAATHFVVVGREMIWQSPVILTPYLDQDSIDARKLESFFSEAYRRTGATRDKIDTGAVILTGEALKRKNARAIADLFARESGQFVCATAGHHLEAVLAANGSGTVARSRRDRQTLLNVDIGGGTTKLALVQDGEIIATAAVAIGARSLVRDASGRLVRIEESARQTAEHLGIPLILGEPLPEVSAAKIVQEWVDILGGLIQQLPPNRLAGGLAAQLMLTEPLDTDITPQAITFSGGVSEFVYLRETRDFGDLGAPLAKALRRALMTGVIKLPVVDPGQGIRATAIGASQFTVQLSGNTLVTNEAMLPLNNVPVILPTVDTAGEIQPDQVASAIRDAAIRADIVEGEQPIALAIRWQGEPTSARLRALAEGICAGIPKTIAGKVPFVLLADYEIGELLGTTVKEGLSVPGDLVSVDGMAVNEFDFVDVSPVVQPANAVPIVVKSLLFAGGLDRRSIAKALTQARKEVRNSPRTP